MKTKELIPKHRVKFISSHGTLYVIKQIKMESMTVQEKIQKCIDTECYYVEKNGSTVLSVCDHYNWDRDLWNYRHEIIDAMKNRGYNVSISCKWDVTDITITKKIEVN